MVNLKNFIINCAILALSIPVYAQIPAIKNGDLIIVDDVLSAKYEIASEQPIPYSLNIIKLEIDESIKPTTRSIDWSLEIDGKEQPFIVGMNGDHIGFVFQKAEHIYVSATIVAKYIVNDIEYVKNELGTYERIEKEKDIYETPMVGARFVIDAPSPTPPTPPNPDPEPQPNLTGYAKQAYDAYYNYVHNTGFNKAKLVDSAHKQAAGLKLISTRIAAGVIPDVPKLLQEVVDSNRRAYVDAGVNPTIWSEFGVFFQDLLWQEYQDKKLDTLQDYQVVLNGIAEGLEAVK